MPRLRDTRDSHGWPEAEWVCCLDCGLRVLSSVNGVVCTGYEGEGCRSRRVVREVTVDRRGAAIFDQARRSRAST